jgi:transcriptional regulator with XRE-family HTH domain
VDHEELGRRLRALRTASGRTVAAVAAEAGLSVPYVANLENGRGNPTTSALNRLAAALGAELRIEFAGAAAADLSGPIPPSLVRLSRTRRFRRDVQVAAEALDIRPEDYSARLLGALAQLAGALGRDPAEADWWRLLDAVLLTAVHPH